MLLCLLALPGCIVQEIRDEIKAANAQLLGVQGSLDQANTGLSNANAALGQANERLDKVDQGLQRLDRTNALIGDVEQGLVRIDRTNASLTDLDRQLAQLISIERSLARLDQHLTAVRKTMAALDGIVPFLDLDTGPVTDVPQTPATPPPAPDAAAVASQDAAAEARAGSPAAPAGEAPEPMAGARSGRDPLLGIWMSQYPEKDHVLILQPGGRYIRSEVGKHGEHILHGGTFAKEPGSEGALRFTPDPVPPPPGAIAPQADAAPGRRDGAGAQGSSGERGVSGAKVEAPPAPVAAPPYAMRIVSQGARALALQHDGVVYVYSRP